MDKYFLAFLEPFTTDFSAVPQKYHFNFNKMSIFVWLCVIPPTSSSPNSILEAYCKNSKRSIL